MGWGCRNRAPLNEYAAYISHSRVEHCAIADREEVAEEERLSGSTRPCGQRVSLSHY